MIEPSNYDSNFLGLLLSRGRMIVHFQHGLRRYKADLSRPVSISVRQSFDQHQINHFGVDLASRQPIRLEGFVGSTRLGGSCNVDQISIIPHCNGTHVEHVGHIVDAIADNPLEKIPPLMLASLISVATPAAAATSEHYRPPLHPEDRVISAASLQAEMGALALAGPATVAALILRTLPNDDAKRQYRYGEQIAPPFLTVDAMEWILEQGFEHLLVDFPSLDRMHDDGLLTNHHLFWNVAERTHDLAADSRSGRSITELVFIPDHIEDGLYVLNLQFPDWASDAAPARPLLFPLQPDDDRD